MLAVLAGEELEVDPTPEFVRTTLAQFATYEHEQDRFICLIRGEEDQLNVLQTDDAYVMEWYLGSEGGHLAGYRSSQAPAQLPRRRGFFASLFKGPSPLHGTRISLEEAASILDAYVDGATSFDDFEWVKI